MACTDRTQEFRAAVAAQSRILGRRPSAPTATSKRSDFSLRAGAIAKDISDTYGMLQRLSQLAKKKPLFDDNPVEIAELTQIMKQKLSRINDAIKALQQSSKNRSDTQLQDHSNNVVVMLQGKLTDVTSGFANVLETRTRTMNETRTRTQKYTGQRAVRQPLLENPLYSRSSSPRQPNAENPYEADPPVGEPDVFSLPEQTQSLTLLEEQQTSYLSQRSVAVDAIESTINELGSIFSQLSTMIAEQSETVQRIDANTEDVVMNVSGAHKELLKFYSRVSSNRWLMIKSFGVVLFFFLLWVLIS